MFFITFLSFLLFLSIFYGGSNSIVEHRYKIATMYCTQPMNWIPKNINISEFQQKISRTQKLHLHKMHAPSFFLLQLDT